MKSNFYDILSLYSTPNIQPSFIASLGTIQFVLFAAKARIAADDISASASSKSGPLITKLSGNSSDPKNSRALLSTFILAWSPFIGLIPDSEIV